MFEEAAKVLMRPGAVGVIPTDTVYGLVARAADRRAVDKLYTLKPREFKPGTLIACSVEQLAELGFKRRYVKAVEQFWPGPVSVIIPAVPELAYLHLGRGSFPVRLPAGEELSKLLQTIGPLMTTSANRPDEPTANTIEEARAIYGDKVDIYVDGGDLSGRPPSTIIRVIDDAIEVIRQGAAKIR
jgi:L-threonylcarbamoyladenylate synthase